LDFALDMMNLFGFDYELEISTRPAKAIGTDEDWERATNALMNALKERDFPYQIARGRVPFTAPRSM